MYSGPSTFSLMGTALPISVTSDRIPADNLNSQSLKAMTMLRQRQSVAFRSAGCAHRAERRCCHSSFGKRRSHRAGPQVRGRAKSRPLPAPVGAVVPTVNRRGVLSTATAAAKTQKTRIQCLLRRRETKTRHRCASCNEEARHLRLLVRRHHLLLAELDLHPNTPRRLFPQHASRLRCCLHLECVPLLMLRKAGTSLPRLRLKMALLRRPHRCGSRRGRTIWAACLKRRHSANRPPRAQ